MKLVKSVLAFATVIFIIVTLIAIIIAVQAQPGGQTDLRVQTCTAEDLAAKGSFAGACDSTYPNATCGTGGDLISCNDGLSESHQGSSSTYGGINTSYYNSTINNCLSVQDVFLCYEWWGDTGLSPSECFIAIDNQGGTNFTNVTTTCPGTSADPGVICDNVTATKSWSCSNFFIGSGNKSNVKSEFRRGVGGGKNMYWDVLLFNVTYSADNVAPSINFTAPTETSGSYLARTNIIVNVTANDSNFARISVSLFNSTGLVNTTTSAISPLFVNFIGLIDGIYYFNASANDTLGNINYTETRNATIDTTKPAVAYGTLTETSGSIITKTNIVVNVTVSDANFANLSVSFFNTTGLVNKTTTASTNLFLNFTSLSDGQYFFNATAYDLAGNFNSTETRNVTVLTADNIAPNVTLISPANNSVDGDGFIIFNISATDNFELKNTSIYINNSLNQTKDITGLSNSSVFNITLPNGNYTWRARVYDNSSFANFIDSENRSFSVNIPAVPITNYSYFSGGSTTNWSALPDLANVCNGTAVLDSGSDMIVWNNCVNAANQNFDINIFLSFNNVTVNASGLHSSFNSSGTITMRNLTWDATPLVYKDGILCTEPLCSNVSYNTTSGVAVFNVTGFTSYVTSGNSQMQIWDETDSGMPFGSQTKYKGQRVKFFSNYTKKTDNSPITGANCNINFTDTSGTMSYNTTALLYEFNRTFATNGTFNWNVTCSQTGFNTQTTNDTVNISADLTAPIVYLISPANGTITNNASQIFSCNITDNNQVSNSTIYIYNSTGSIINTTTSQISGIYNTSNFSIALPYNDIFLWNCFGVDTSSNGNWSVNGNFSLRIDTTNPNATLLSPANNTYTNVTSQNFTANLSDSNSGLKNATLNIYNQSGLVNQTTVSTGGVAQTVVGVVVTVIDGIYSWFYKVFDMAGNIFTTGNNTLTVDTVKPSVSLVSPSPANGIYTGSNSAAINATAADSSGINSCTLNFDGTSEAMTKTGTTSAVCNSTKTGLADGLHNFTVYANDSAGNINNTETRYFIIDTINPGINFTTPTETSGSYLARNNIFANFSASDANFNYTDIILYNQTTTINISTFNTTQFIINYTNLLDGLYFFEATVFDKAGNSNTTETRNATIDTIKPSINFTSPTEASGSVIGRSNILVNVSATDANFANVSVSLFNSTGLVNTTTSATSPLFVNFTSLSEGIYFFNATTTDLANNRNTTETRNATIDITKPSVFDLRPIAGTNVSSSTIEISANATDLYGIGSVRANITFPNSSSQIITLTNTGGDKYNNSFSIPSLIGRYNITIIANDSVGNTNNSETTYFFATDIFPPNVQFVSPTPANGSIQGSTIAIINVTASDSIGVDSCTLNFDGVNESMIKTGTTSAVCNSTKAGLADGLHNFTVYVNDTSGNINQTETRYFTVNTAFPAISFVAPTETSGSYLARTNIVVNVTANDTDLVNITINLFNSTDLVNTTTSATSPLFVNITSLADGIYYFNATACDFLALCASTATRDSTIDTTFPLIDYGTGTVSNGANLSQSNVYINVTVVETNEANITFRLFNSSGSVNTTTLGAGNRTFNFTSLVDGVYTYNVTVADLANNQNTTSTRTIRLDTTASNATLLSPANNTYTNVTSQNFTANLSDSGSGLKNATLNIYNQSGLVNQTTVSTGGVAQTVIGVVVTVIDGIYSWFYKVFDMAGNIFTTGNNTLTIDTVKPSVSLVSPTETSGSYLARTNIIVNVTANDSNFANVSVSLFNSTGLVNSTTTTTSPNFVNITGLADGLYFFNATATDLANNKNSTETRNTTIDATYPTIEYGDGTAANGVALQQSNVYINVTVVETNEANITFRLFNSSGLVNASFYATAQRVINFTNLSDATYYYNITVADLAGNVNTSATRSITLGITPLNITNIINYPNTSDNIDPGATIFINATVSGGSAGVDSVILQYYNGTTYANVSMINLTASLYQANITLIGTETNYTYNIFANNTAGSATTTSNTSFESAWDCTWIASPSSLGAIAGFDENKFIGNITINNTGDAQYSNSNCTLNYRLTYDLTEGRIYFDDIYFKPSNTYIIAAKNNQSIKVNATFLTSAQEDNVIITINDISGRSNMSGTNLSATIVTTVGGPYLYEEITSAPSSVYLTPGNFTLESYARNLRGDGTINNTAYNVSFNWTLPSGFIVGSGNATKFFENISNNSAIENDIIINFTSANLGSLSPGINTIYLYAQGYNSSGSVIVHSGNRTLLTDSADITLSCYNISDGITVDACGSLDGDYVAPVTPVIVTTTGGGGGGGGGAAAPKEIVYSKIVEVVRSETDSFSVDVSNKLFGSTLEDLTLEISGFLEKYISVSPKAIKRINYNETESFKVTISAPSYKEYEEYDIKAVVKGDVIEEGKIKSTYTETQNIKLIIQEIPYEKSKSYLEEAKNAIALMLEKGFNINLVNRLLESAEQKLADKRNKESYDLAGNVIATKDLAFEVDALITNLNLALENPRKIYLLTGGAISDFSGMGDSNYITGDAVLSSESFEEMLSLAVVAFERGDYQTAKERAEAARTILLLERQGNIWLFLYLNWIYILLFIILLFGGSIISYRAYQKSSISKRISDLNKEENNIINLMQDTQSKYFSGKLGIDDYNRQLNNHNNRLAKIKKNRFTLRNKRLKLLSKQNISNNLQIESDQIESAIKKLQRDYYINKTINEKEYKSQFNNLNDRLAEIEDERITFHVMATHPSKDKSKKLYEISKSYKPAKKQDIYKFKKPDKFNRRLGDRIFNYLRNREIKKSLKPKRAYQDIGANILNNLKKRILFWRTGPTRNKRRVASIGNNLFEALKKNQYKGK